MSNQGEPVIDARQQNAPDRTDKTRIPWPDAAKGLCMILVVLGHSAIWFDQQVAGNATFWLTVTDVLAPFRMPLFFLISGLMSVNALSRPLDLSRKRTIGLLYLYALWTGLFLARLFVPGASDGENPPDALEIVVSILLPTPFWYLWALPIYFTLTWVAFRVLAGRARLWLLIPLVALSAVSPWIGMVTDSVMREPLDPLKLGPAASNVLWFYLGACLPAVWSSMMKRARWSYLAGAAVLYTALIVPVLAWGVRDETKVLLAPLALLISANAFALFGMDNRPMRWMQWVGRSTLPVYILHLFAISVISAAVTKTGLADALTANPLIEFMVPPAMAVALTVSCVWAGKLLLGSHYTSWLLDAPTAMTAPRRTATK
ncbi:acyltransferase family protein [Rhodococcus pyridinivorans]|uniref:acyltransferase family protein n=1 Tax=Rhodococcus pyridinivorans TaxID=103816 RepID=UPI0013A6F36A|nr:acyltransferase [Rhodococcus pyridinivorans]